jgi:hypothetical protein
MAIEDYYKTLYFVDKTRRPDDTGSFEYVYVIGDSFKGSCIRSSAEEQILAGIRGNLQEQFNITVDKKIPLSKDDVIMFIDDDNSRVFIRIDKPSLRTPTTSTQHNWKGLSGSSFEPDIRVIN